MTKLKIISPYKTKHILFFPALMAINICYFLLISFFSQANAQILSNKKNENSNAQNIFEELFNKTFSLEKGHLSIPEKKDIYFVVVNTDKKQVYVKEQILVDWYIYTTGLIENLDRIKFPLLEGFWKEEIAPVPRLYFQQAILQGSIYRRALLAKHALFPLKKGDLKIDSYRLKGKVLILNKKNNSYTLGKSAIIFHNSPEVIISAKELPAPPDNFSLLVGQFDIKVYIKNHNLYTDEPFILNIKVSGEGNVKFLKTIPLPAINGIEIYDIDENTQYNANGKSYKEIKYYLLAKKDGIFNFPSIKLCYFDPEKEIYITKESQNIKINVTKSSDNNKNKNAQIKKFSENLTNKKKPLTLPQIITKPPGNSSFKQIYQNINFWIILYITSIILSLIYIWWLIENKIKKEKKWEEILNHKFNKIDYFLKKDDYRQLSYEVLNLIYLVLYNVPHSSSKEKEQDIENILKTILPSIRKKHASSLQELTNFFQFLAFAQQEKIQQFTNKKEIKSSIKKIKKIIQTFDSYY